MAKHDFAQHLALVKAALAAEKAAYPKRTVYQHLSFAHDAVLRPGGNEAAYQWYSRELPSYGHAWGRQSVVRAALQYEIYGWRIKGNALFELCRYFAEIRKCGDYTGVLVPEDVYAEARETGTSTLVTGWFWGHGLAEQAQLAWEVCWFINGDYKRW